MFNNLKSEIENFYTSPADFMFVDGYSGIGKSLFAKQICEDINRVTIVSSAVLTNVPSSGSEKEFIIALLRKMDFNPLRNTTLELENQLLLTLSRYLILVIDESQNLLISNKMMLNHFSLLSRVVDQTNIKVLYIGTLPLQSRIESLNIANINRRSIHYSLIA
ncbi:AAA family ATPase [Paenibacillus sp. LMG 31458]|uniref:AAA family ATPase n=1 Tax=Paenibacillus phytorum TaxID=2654977 RepID=A0ABX1Y1I3_9BACL|nr:ATP-binding protein [Paenibacillus phytorum]NOU74710.1 AAA family ATPase [Paenibacillus phytorum]